MATSDSLLRLHAVNRLILAIRARPKNAQCPWIYCSWWLYFLYVQRGDSPARYGSQIALVAEVHGLSLLAENCKLHVQDGLEGRHTS